MPEQMTIAVTGLGGGVGQSITKSLYQTDYRIVGMDGEALATGLHAVPQAYVIPYANKPDFIDRVLEICQKEHCQLLFPGFDAELPYFAKATDRFATIGTKVIVSSPEVVEIADNKLLTYSELTKHDISVPYTVDMADHLQNGAELPVYPFILKPKTGGARSKDVYKVTSPEQLAEIKANTSVDLHNSIAQEYIEGDEYTCGTVTLEGRHIGSIIMRRILRDGDTYKCFTVRNPVIEAELSKVVAALKPVGALNIQLRVKDGKPYIFELNARCSGTTGARSLAGFNEPKMIADFYLQNQEPRFDIQEVSILRYWKELVVPNENVANLKEAGSISNSSFTKL